MGISSFDVLRDLKRKLEIKKAGYLGTLDPLATGVLVVFVGRGTQLIQYFEKTIKSYTVGFELGKVSDSYDITGEVKQCSSSLPPREVFDDQMRSFLGSQLQIQPAFSAIKIQGKRSYEHAREGKVMDLGKRQVEISELEVMDFSPPHVQMHLSCSSGTYVRSFVHELGEQLKCGAVMSSLVRTAVGPFHVKHSQQLSDVQAEKIIGIDDLVDHYADWTGYSSGEADYLKKRLS